MHATPRPGALAKAAGEESESPGSALLAASAT